jgi:serine O-acetyltransferase
MDCTLKQIADNLITSYHEVGGINRIDCGNLPSKRRIAAICEQLLQLLFPGFHDEEPIASEELEMMTNERIAELVQQFEIEIAKSLRLRDVDSGSEDVRVEAHNIVCEFLNELPRLRELLRTDVVAAYEGDPAAKNFDEVTLAYPCVEAIAIQRVAHVLYLKDLPLIPRVMTEWVHSLTGIDIHPGAEIGTHFFIDHGTGVVIGETCVIGNYVKLYHGVTLGARSFPKDENGRVVKGNKRHPNVEDKVTIYPNATVLGGQTTIGEGSTVGANVFLRQSIPAGSFVSNETEYLRVIDKGTGKIIHGFSDTPII